MTPNISSSVRVELCVDLILLLWGQPDRSPWLDTGEDTKHSACPATALFPGARESLPLVGLEVLWPTAVQGTVICDLPPHSLHNVREVQRFPLYRH